MKLLVVEFFTTVLARSTTGLTFGRVSPLHQRTILLNDNAKKWVAALRSGKYKQTRHVLCDRNGHCCLGVACEVAIENGVPLTRESTEFGRVLFNVYALSLLPYQVRDWLGLRNAGGTYGDGSLLHDNDSRGLTFEQIADIIESEPSGLFREDAA
jgi:hypothetical protein